MPERWLEGTPEAAARPAHGWAPFGDGVRACIGTRFALAVRIHTGAGQSLEDVILLTSLHLHAFCMSNLWAVQCAGGQDDAGEAVPALHV